MKLPLTDQQFVRNAIEASIKIAVIFLIASWCFDILRPFIAAIVWAGVIAIAIKPLSDWLSTKFHGRQKLAAVMITSAMLVMLITPTVMMGTGLLENVQQLSARYEAGELRLQPPSDSIQDWPLVGEKLYKLWLQASVNLEAAIGNYDQQIKTGLKAVLSGLTSVGGAVLLFALSIIISGFFLVSAEGLGHFFQRLGSRLGGETGTKFVTMVSGVVRNVARGIIGVAVIQAILATIGLVVMEIPAAPLIAFGVLTLAIVQLTPGLILIPVSIYAFSEYSTLAASLFLVWNILVGALDNVLKPLLMGQGAQVPMLVIFLGAIGGFINMGLVGLFVGAVVIVLGYELFQTWLELEQTPAEIEDQSSENH